MSIRILLVDDHGVVRQGLRLYLKYDPELEVVGEASDGAEALRRASTVDAQSGRALDAGSEYS